MSLGAHYTLSSSFDEYILGLVVEYLTARDIARMSCTCQQCNVTLAQEWVWKGVLTDWRRRPWLLLWPGNNLALRVTGNFCDQASSGFAVSSCSMSIYELPDLDMDIIAQSLGHHFGWESLLDGNTTKRNKRKYEPSVIPSRTVLQRTGLKCKLSLQLFLPDMLGYSLIQPGKPFVVKQLPMTLTSCVDCAGVRKLEQTFIPNFHPDWALLVSDNSTGLEFWCPYKTYWLDSRLSFMSSHAGSARTNSDVLKSFSLNAQRVCELDVATMLASEPESQISEMQRQMLTFLADSEVDFSFAFASTSSTDSSGSDGVKKSYWVVDSTQVADPNAKYHVFYLVNSSTKSSRVRVDRVAAAVHKDKWAEVIKC